MTLVRLCYILGKYAWNITLQVKKYVIEFRHKPNTVKHFDCLWSDVRQEPWINLIILLSHSIIIGDWIDRKWTKIILCFSNKNENLWSSLPHMFNSNQTEKLRSPKMPSGVFRSKAENLKSFVIRCGSQPFNSHMWLRQNFSSQYHYNENQKSDEKKEKY